MTIALDPRTHSAVTSSDGPDKTKEMSIGEAPIPLYGVLSFSELEDIQAQAIASEQEWKLRDFLQAIIGNILCTDLLPEIQQDLIATATRDYHLRVAVLRGMESTDELPAPMERTLGDDGPEVEDEDVYTSADGGMLLWKEKNSGRLRILTAFSNQFRDKDNPSEILSEKAHKTYVDMVDQGIIDYPEGWHWHTPGTRWWKADWLDYSDGFILASGLVDPGHEHEAYAVAEMGDAVAMSHGMLPNLLIRQQLDPSVIDFYITKEITDLPSPVAANPLTGILVLKEGEDMALTPAKRQYLLKAGLTDEQVAALEGDLATKSSEARESGLEYKEAGTDSAEAVAEAVAEAPAEESTEVAVETAPEPVLEPAAVMAEAVQPAVAVSEEAFAAFRNEVADSLASIMNTFAESLAVITEQMTGRLDGVELAVKEMSASDQERVADLAAATPPTSLAAMIQQRAITSNDARIRANTKLAKDRPHEKEANEVAGPTPYSFLNSLVAASRNGYTDEAN